MSRGIVTGLAILLASAALPSCAFADDGAAMAARFGALDDVSSAALSPDGTKIALVSSSDDGTRFIVADLSRANPPKLVLGMQAKDGRLTSCLWATLSRLVCQARFQVRGDFQLLTYTRAIATNADGTGMTQLSAETNFNSIYSMQFGGGVIDYNIGDAPSAVLMTRRFVPEKSIASRAASTKEGFGVELVDTVTLKRKVVEAPRNDATSFLSDGYGVVRVTGRQVLDQDGFLKDVNSYFYRKAGSDEWLPLSVVKRQPTGHYEGFVPAAVDSSANVVYGFEQKDGFSALYSVALDGSGTKTGLLSRPGYDVNELIRIGRSGRVVGASYATDRNVVDYFDPTLKRLVGALSRALTGQPLIDVLDASQDESKLLISASSDTDPGVLYVYDKTTHKLDQVMAVRSKLEGMALAPMRAITFKAADGTSIPGYLTLPLGSSGKGLPAIVMPHGGPSARDVWGFDWLVQFYAMRGFAVLQPNYRGSTGYGADFYQRNGFQSWRTAIGDVNDAARWLVAEGIAAPDKLAAVGWSYGGYAALQGAVVDPGLYRAVVAIAPVTDFGALKSEYGDFTIARIIQKQIGSGPHIEAGSPARNASRIMAPVLLFHGDKDQNVDIAESRLMARRLTEAGKAVTLHEFPGFDHYLLSGQVRTQMLQESDAFLRKALGIMP